MSKELFCDSLIIVIMGLIPTESINFQFFFCLLCVLYIVESARADHSFRATQLVMSNFSFFRNLKTRHPGPSVMCCAAGRNKIPKNKINLYSLHIHMHKI